MASSILFEIKIKKKPTIMDLSYDATNTVG